MSAISKRLYAPLLLAIFLAIGPRPALGEGALVVRVHDDMSGGFGPVAGPRAAASDLNHLTIAWCVGEGRHAGVYYRQRNDLLWDPIPTALEGDIGAEPRDLHLTYDTLGRVHLVWTALEGGRRRVFHAVVTDMGQLSPPRVVNPTDEKDADYPLVATQGDLAYYIVWQSQDPAGIGIDSVRIDPLTFEPTRLPPVSGDSDSAIGPHLVRADPPIVGYYEISEHSSRFQSVSLNLVEHRWQRVSLSGLDPLLPFGSLPFVSGIQRGLPVASWTDEGEDGRRTVRVARRTSLDDDRLIVETLDDPEGDHRRPHLIGAGPDRVSVAWQAFADGFQQIRLVRIDWLADEADDAGEADEALTVSPRRHRFASDASHCGASSWSIVVWTDDRSDGGSGELGLAEVTWPVADDSERAVIFSPNPYR